MTNQEADPYIQQLVDTAENEKISAAEDIFNSHGVKLIASGTRIDRNVYQKLIHNKLLKPIDSSLNIENGVDTDYLIKEIQQLSQNDFSIGIVWSALEDEGLTLSLLKKLTIIPALSVKLTVTRDQAPDKFRHLIAVAIASLYLGVCEQMSEQQLIKLFYSGLFHDLGEMHLSPALFDRSTQLDAELWRQIYSHPIIIQLILNEFPEYKPEISQAILEHHERLDGSGYPRGISGDQISPLGRILAVAELGVVLMDSRKNETDWDHLVTSIKINAAKYDPKLIRHMVNLFKKNQPVDSKPVVITKKETQQLWEVLADLMSKSAVIISTKDPANASLKKFLRQNMDAIKFELSRSGIDPGEISSFISQIEEASVELNELHAMAKESLYRIYEIGHQIQRRWPDLVAQQSAESDINVWLSLSRNTSNKVEVN